jgi:hypothetical protein
MPWNTAVFDSTGKIKDARVGFVPFPVQEFTDALITYRGGTPIPITNSKYWTKPTYPTLFTSTETTTAAFEIAVNAASPGDTIALQDGAYALDDMTFTANGTAANPITIVSETKGGVDLANSTLTLNGDFLIVLGFDECRIDANGDDCVIAYITRTATSQTFYISDGHRNRMCYNSLSGMTADDQYFNVVGAASAITYNRIDHNYFGPHTSTSGGASEIGQTGQNQLGTAYYFIFDSNYVDRHLNASGPKTDPNEGETVSLKSDFNMIVNNLFRDCNSHCNIREGRGCSIYANWVDGGGGDETGGFNFGGTDNLIACNYVYDSNSDDATGQGFIDGVGGDPLDPYREECDDAEIAHNTGNLIKRGIGVNRTGLATVPKNMLYHNNAVREATTRNVIWIGNGGTTPTWGGNVFGPNAGVTNAGITEALPDFANGGYNIQVPDGIGGNLDSNATAIASMGVIMKALNTAGVLYDILGNTIPTTGADIGAIQLGYDLTINPMQSIIDRSGPLA